MNRRSAMEEARDKEKEEILVVDTGLDMDSVSGAGWFCCRGPYSPFR
jgi:hypothetical protein